MSKKEQQYVNIGRTRKAHGITGEIKISILDQYLEDFLKTERIFIEFKGMYIPYFIKNLRGKGEMILELEEVSTRDAAQALQHRDVFLREQDVLSENEREFEVPDESLQYEKLVGYTILDKSLGEIGPIDEVLEMPQQEMAFMKYKGKDVLIPLNDSLSSEVDDLQRIVYMELPEGLLDVWNN